MVKHKPNKCDNKPPLKWEQSVFQHNLYTLALKSFITLNIFVQVCIKSLLNIQWRNKFIVSNTKLISMEKLMII